ncbi:hypothetical protein BsWGS_13280 [Bradybaena similaris]
MELSSNQPLPSLRVTLIMAHILNLTYADSGNATSSLITSIANILVPIDTDSATGTEASASLASASSSNPPDGVIVRGRNTKSEKSDVDNLETFNKYFTSVIDPVVIVTGIVGNALLALVFTITPLRLRPLSNVLSVLSVADLMYISSYLLVYLTKRDVNVYDIPGLCQVLNFVLTFSKSVEGWYIFLSHLSRLKAHTSAGPETQRRRVFNMKFANALLAMLVAAPLLHVLWSTETVRVASTTYCVPMRETIAVHLTLRKLEIVATVFLPLVLIAGVDLMLVFKLVMYIAFKNNNNKNEDSSSASNHKYFTSSSCPEKTVLVTVQTERCCDEKVADSNKNTDTSFSDINKELSLALQIAYHILHETPSSDVCGSEQNSFQHEKLTDLDNARQAFSGCPRDMQCPAGSSDSVNYCSDSAELQQQFPGHRSNLSLVDTAKYNTLEGYSSSDHRLADNTSLEVALPNSDSGRETTDLLSCSQVLIAKNSKALTRSSKQYNITNFILNSVRKYTFFRSSHFNQHRHMVTYDYNQISTQVTNSDNQSITFTSSHRKSQEYSSSLSTPSRVRPEDRALPNDTVACTATTVLLGLILAITFLPSAYTQAVKLFLDSPSSPPSPQQLQQAILFESLVKLNACYKLFVYMLVMPSFRSAVVWLLRHWVPGKLTRMSSMCSPCAMKTELVYV